MSLDEDIDFFNPNTFEIGVLTDKVEELKAAEKDRRSASEYRETSDDGLNEMIHYTKKSSNKSTAISGFFLFSSVYAPLYFTPLLVPLSLLLVCAARRVIQLDEIDRDSTSMSLGYELFMRGQFKERMMELENELNSYIQK